VFHQHGRYDFGVQPVYFGYTPAFDFEAMPTADAVVAGVSSLDLNPADIVSKMADILKKARREGEKTQGTQYYDMYIQHVSQLQSIEAASTDPVQTAANLINKMNTYFEKHWSKVAPEATKAYRDLLNGLNLDAVEVKSSPNQQLAVAQLKDAVLEGKSIVQPWYTKTLKIGGIAFLIGVPLYLVMRKR
jgi:hypothetical protein